MTREQQLKYCRTCKKQSFEPLKGVTCSLTKEQATFTESCPDYEEDSTAKALYDIEQSQQEKEEFVIQSSFTILDAVRLAVGILSLVIGIAWMAYSILEYSTFSFWPLALSCSGLFLVITSNTPKSILRKKGSKRKSGDTLDANLFGE